MFLYRPSVYHIVTNPLAASLYLEKGLKSKVSEVYSGDTQKSFDRYIRECANEFDLRPNTYQADRTKILFASGYLSHAAFNDGHRHREGADIGAYTWDHYVSFLQEHLKPLHMRIAEVGQKLKHASYQGTDMEHKWAK